VSQPDRKSKKSNNKSNMQNKHIFLELENNTMVKSRPPVTIYVFLSLVWLSYGFRACNAFLVAPSLNQEGILSVAATTSIPILDDDDSGARSSFGTRDYWDDVYLGRGDFPAEEYSWYYGWEGYGKYVKEYVPNKESRILLPGIGNDPMLLDLLKKGYTHLTATDYSEHAIERQAENLSYETSYPETVELATMDARQMDESWTNKFDAIIEKGVLDAIYLSGDGNLELSVAEFKRILKPTGIVMSISGVVPEELRRQVFKDQDWIFLRDGTDDLQAGCFILTAAP
jgi:SAM-dependent methyltransferase